MGDDFVEELGLAVLPHHVRRAMDALVRDADLVTRAFGLSIPHRCCSTVLLLDEAGPMGVMETAKRLKLSHPVVIGFAKTLRELGLVEDQPVPGDARVRLLALTPEGRAEAGRVRQLHAALAQAHADVSEEVGVDLLAACQAVTEALSRRSLLERIELPEKEKSDEVV
ncbi:MarR family winged helix-turn-helix transcriptional regulator [Maricaulis parjimensis]|uniref:MarR family winged helix-turn-helix transcriptional regulator n=1 Tax=Maricaulis parjimensis TaxID=144023 RepID=UPI00193962B4|nr:hypothetical protein [Maricaulis parjimensis]